MSKVFCFFVKDYCDVYEDPYRTRLIFFVRVVDSV